MVEGLEQGAMYGPQVMCVHDALGLGSWTEVKLNACNMGLLQR